MDNNRILIVDDEEDISAMLAYNLQKEGFEVETAVNGKDALKIAQSFMPHLILLDVMMPEMDGMETCVELRKMDQMSNVIIAFLTARSEDYSQIAGFDSGADDYITKPIKPRVIISRVKALLRRSGNLEDQNNEVNNEIEGIRIDKEQYMVYVNNEELNLPRKEFELLSLLSSKPGKVFTRDIIMKEIWGDDVIVGDRTIDVHIRKLREKLNMDIIKTIKGVGYKIESK